MLKQRSKSFERFPILISYAYARHYPDQFQKLIDAPHVDILLDSGAFTAYNSGKEVTLDEYCKFLDQFGKDLYAYLALDVVFNAEATEANLAEMYKQGYTPMPVHVVGDDERKMDELFELTDYVALAGVNRTVGQEVKKSLVDSYIKKKMEWAKGRKVHWLGVTRRKILAAFTPYSCDSCTWANGRLYGQLGVYLGNGNWCMAYQFKDRAKVLQNKQAMRVVRQFHPDAPRLLRDPTAWRAGKDDTGLVSDLMLDSWIRFQLDFYRRFQTRIFFASNPAPGTLDPLLKGLERHRDQLNR